MSNRAIWGVRKRHEWLAKPCKKQTMTRRGRVRIGLQAAMDRKAEKAARKAPTELTDSPDVPRRSRPREIVSRRFPQAPPEPEAQRGQVRDGESGSRDKPPGG